MKKIYMGMLLAFLAVTLPGCVRKGEEQFTRTEGALGLTGCAASEDKCIYEDGGLLYIQDIETNQSMVFCSKPDCRHEPADEETNPDPECEAALRPNCLSFASVGLHKDKVYAFEESMNANEMILYCKALSGQGWSRLAAIPYVVEINANSYFVDGYAYIVAKREENPLRIGEATKEQCVLLKVDLSNGKYEKLGTEYSADGWCRMLKLDYSGGKLCYELSILKEGYTQKDIEVLAANEWSSILDVSVMLVDAGTGEEQKLDIKKELAHEDFGFGDYVCYSDGIVYYKDNHAVAKWNVEKQQMENAIGEYEEGATVRAYPPVGIMVDNGKEQRIYDIKKKRWLEAVNPEKETTTNIGFNNYTSQYVRVHFVIGKEGDGGDAILCAKWVTWEDYIAGTWMPAELDSDIVVMGGGEQENSAAGGAHVEPVLDDAYYDAHWEGKTVLTWWGETEIPAHIIARLNDTLVEKGRDYVVREKCVDMDIADDEYFDSLIDAKNNREALDIFITPTEREGDKPENKYEKCINAGLLEPLTEFLRSDKGEKFYHAFHKKQWEAMEVDGDIYSYDNRVQPVSDIILTVSRKYIDKYGFAADDITTMEDVFQMAQEVSEKEDNDSLVPVLWTMGEDESSVRKASIEGLSKLRDAYRGFRLWDSSVSDSNFAVFAWFQPEYLESVSAEETIFRLPEQHVEKVKSITVKEGTYLPLTNWLTAVASWSEHKEEAMDFIALANTDKDIATILQFGQEGWDYTLEDGRIKNGAPTGLDICNKRITPPYLLEPDDKEAVYRSYIEERLKD